MIPQGSVSRKCDGGGDAAAYLLGALEQHEAEDFARHMSGCVVCRDEVVALQGIVDALPLAADQYPIPPRLHRRLRHAVRTEPRHRRRAEWRPLLLASHLRASVRGPVVVLGMLLVAALAIAGGLELASEHPVGARVIEARVIGLPGSAELRVTGGRGELVIRRLPPPPAGRIYEVWLKRPRQPLMPTGALFSVSTTGGSKIGVPADLHGVEQLLVTQEPAGGSVAPTHPPVIVARLTSA